MAVEVRRVQPLEWMRAVRDAEPKPGPRSARREVLWALGLRMNADGTGFASEHQLADDTERGISTVRRQLTWARSNRYLDRTRRGHRINAETAVASEWQLTSPVDNAAQPLTPDRLTTRQPPTGERLAANPTAQMGQPNRSDGPTQPPAPDPPRGLQQEVTQQERTTSPVQTVTRATGASPAEAAAVVELIQTEKHPDNLPGLVAHLARAGELPIWLDRVRAERTRTDLADWVDSLKTMPPCPHEVPGGDQLRPDRGVPQCPLCRLAFRRAA